MARTTSKGLTVWNLTTDPFDHNQLAANWDLIDSLFSQSGKAIQTVSTLTPGAGGPQTPLNAGDLVMTNSTVGGFPAWTLLRYDGSGWESVGPIEVQSSLPVSNLYNGRVVVLSAATTNFSAWTAVRYNGSSWDYLSPFGYVNTGNGAANIQGVQINGDVYLNSGSRGIVLVDRTSTTKYRLYIDKGVVRIEAVT